MGSILVDIINTVPGYPQLGELTQISHVQRAVGGCVPNVAIDLKRLSPDLDVFASGRVADDENGRYAVSILEENGVDTGNIVTAGGGNTSFTQVMSVSGGQRTFFTYPGASSDFCAEDVDLDKLRPKLLHLGYFLLLRRIDEGDGLKILKSAAERGIRTSCDLVSENSDRYKTVLPCLPYIDYLIINELEGGRLAGTDPDAAHAPEMAKKLLRLGVREKVIIHYKEGAVCADKSGEVTSLASVPLPKEEIKGTTGAGDAFCAGALLGIYRGLSDTEILDCGRIAAARALRAEDAVSGVVDLEEARKIAGGYESEGQPSL